MTTQNTPREWAKDYIDVATRIAEFRAKHPEGSLQPADLYEPIKIIQIADKTYLQYVACAYRSPEDTKPGIGIAWELFPGRTPFTRDSEAMVCETSAWGRAIVAVLAADTKKGIASAEEIIAAKERQAGKSNNKVEEVREYDLGWQSRDEEQPKRASEKQVQKIQIQRREIAGLEDDGEFSQKLLKSYGVISVKDLTQKQASDLIEKLTKAQDQQRLYK
jgi:hypothetical protein